MGISLPVEEWNPGLLILPEERALIKQLAWFPNLLEESAAALEPHRLTVFLQELAGKFHRYYHDHRILPGKKEGREPEVDPGRNDEIREEDLSLARARLALIDSIQVVLKKGLGILGISAPDKM